MLVWVPEPVDGRGLADPALDEVARQLGRRHALQHWEPDEALRLALDPPQEVLAVDVRRRRGGLRVDFTNQFLT
jgi:hypothetical protein